MRIDLGFGRKSLVASRGVTTWKNAHLTISTHYGLRKSGFKIFRYFCLMAELITIAKSYNAEMTGVDNTSKQELMKSMGYDYVIDYTKEDFTRNGSFGIAFFLDVV